MCAKMDGNDQFGSTARGALLFSNFRTQPFRYAGMKAQIDRPITSASPSTPFVGTSFGSQSVAEERSYAEALDHHGTRVFWVEAFQWLSYTAVHVVLKPRTFMIWGVGVSPQGAF